MKLDNVGNYHSGGGVVLKRWMLRGLLLISLVLIGTGIALHGSSAEEEAAVTQGSLSEAEIDALMGEPLPVPTVEELTRHLKTFQREVAPRIKEEFERTLAMRQFVEAKLAGDTVDVDRLIANAQESARFERAWLAYAETEYGVVASEEEVDAWIEAGPDTYLVDSAVNFAEALGVSLNELNHVTYRDQYVKWVVWEQLIPRLTAKYEQESAGVKLDNNELIRRYEAEVRTYMNN